jgi:hypothetical protein
MDFDDYGFDLLRLVVGGVGGVAALAVAVLALDYVIILGLLHENYLLDATFTGSSNRPGTLFTTLHFLCNLRVGQVS